MAYTWSDGDEITAARLNQSGMITMTASDALKASADTQRAVVSGTEEAVYGKIKEIRVSGKGSVRVKFDIVCSSSGRGFGRIYINGVAVGTERTATGEFVTFSEDFSYLDIGDKIQLYVKGTTGYTETITVKNFRIYYDLSYSYDYDPVVIID